MASPTSSALKLEWGFPEHYIEKRQLFLRSYHFSRKRDTAAERLRSSTVRVGRLICFRLRAARRLPHLLWAGLRAALYGRRRRHRRFSLLRPTTAGFCSCDLVELKALMLGIIRGWV
ncbi:hypothetical protein KFK09_012967 [Dendrobium nobile]|uniref:Uncharacterized protein n=1 Tax=Dendrobium nobile TaxID=94219 RepID=A0A8T3BMB8_DENNO|nr:hypothetical protein KFK09_012967 [Dendrobium nobile]